VAHELHVQLALLQLGHASELRQVYIVKMEKLAAEYQRNWQKMGEQFGVICAKPKSSITGFP
jgi:hypothetical protein